MRERLQDLLLALFITVMQVQGTLTRVAGEPEPVDPPLGTLGLALLVLSGLVLIVRRRWPVAVFAVVAIISLVYYLLDLPDGPGWLALFVALYTLTAQGDGRRSVLIAGAGIGILAVGWLVAAADIEPRAALGWVFFRIGASVMSAALGENVRTRRVIATEALHRAELAERTREQEARARVGEERLRIAREVHDTVAHAIAIINVQSGVTAHVLDKRPDQARDALRVIEQTSSRALQELRTILGVLRDPGPSSRGLAEIVDLTDAAREAGLDVVFEPSSSPPDVPSAVGGTVYRIVQESITNVINHAGPTRVTVAVDYEDDAVRVRVTDAGPPGRGIPGMRERCRLLGGDLDAGPLPDGGFQVSARLPLSPS